MSSITVGVYLGKKDRLVRYWYEILPKGQFPMLVKYCIQSYLRNNYFPLQSICDGRMLKEQIQSRSDYVPTQRNVTFTPEDGPVYQWIKNLESGYRSEEIKNILKETVLHTLLNEQPVFSSRPFGQIYNDPQQQHAMMQGQAIPAGYGYVEDPQKVTMIKREQMPAGMEDGYQMWDKAVMQPQTEGEQKKEQGPVKGYNHLVNYLG
ncbi:hypothetical protein [Thermoactinomyces sp. DSM 45892]|uniref:hypothetical protein n=1 Tax=Thermoactinomyces sp. DSM 45892 TaxID=1882753 RepID=UPI00089CD826|nr:hypothetical protein [Thermoactinomyces sp. DSM 45892]SDY37926.1 hypothetical protein SAMN05444416_10493 [Thermoactinomyces sp. DSM 45892]